MRRPDRDVCPPSPSLAPFDTSGATRDRGRRRRLLQELLIRGGVSALVVAFQLVDHVLHPDAHAPLVFLPALVGLLINGPYYLAARGGRWFRGQAYARMVVDIALITLGLHSAGGLAAGHYLAIYLIVTIYAGLVLSSSACVVATALATASYVGLVMLQQAGLLAAPPPNPANPPAVAAFNLIVLNVGGLLTAVLARALRESRRRLRATYQGLERFIDAVPDVLYVLDREGRLTLWNQRLESATGLGAGELSGTPLVDLLAEADRGAMREALARCLAGGRFEVESALRGAGGAAVPYQWSGAALLDERGRVSGLGGVGRDVTQRNLTDAALHHQESEMRRLQRMEAVGRLAGGVAHDFNNLLTVIIGRCQLLLFRRRPEDPGYSDLELIENTAQRAANLTRQLLVFSRRQALSPQVLNLNAVVTGVTTMLRPIIGERVELVASLDPRIGSVTADPGQLEQVIVNLAVNARDAMPGGGRLTIQTREVQLDEAFTVAHPEAAHGPHVLLEVRDTGVGMDEETRQRVFEPFFTTKTPDQGTGLGLSTVYGIVKQHGGYVAVASAPGQGATFSVYLPRTEAPAAVVRSESGPASLPRGEETILVVEDKDDVRWLVREMLSRLGYEVLTARGGAEALELSRRFPGPIHLLLTDVVMPGMTGRELAERLRATRPDTPALFTSGHASEVEGAEDLLQKPFTAEALALKVAATLRSAATPAALVRD